MSDEAGAAFRALVDIMARLRAPGGCPWDREQTLATLRPYVLEEAYEVVDAIDRGDPQALCEELGDLLLQIVFQAEIARESGQFTAADVARAIADKLVRRHPHVFGDVTVRDAAEVVRNWQRLKDAERLADTGDAAAAVPRALPALPRAQKLAGVLARRGFDWPDPSAVLDKIEEEVRELRAAVAGGDPTATAHELGDLLLATASLARHLDVPAEVALHDATVRLLERVRRVEDAARARGLDTASLPAEELDRLWEAAKQRG
ncbi:MAG TPA: nucleoside triphosphate pyrophosphohydrolase [Candidatus Limnocylindria bacterium]|nr:nucleoside triphosphate pyrophosphohydrolase [Candidatus Limnocylindria bacterium]